MEPKTRRESNTLTRIYQHRKPSFESYHLLSTEERLEEVPAKKEVKDQVFKEFVIENKEAKPKTKGSKPEKKISHIFNISIIWQIGDGSGASDAL